MASQTVTQRVFGPFVEAFESLDRSILANSKPGGTAPAPSTWLTAAWRAAFLLTAVLAFVKYARMMWGRPRQ